jgi:diacylglycerol O-acyltransferase
VVDGAALNITAMTYRGQIGFGLLACPESVPDIDVVGRLIPESMTQLTKAVSAAGSVSARRSRRTSPAR